MKYIKCQSCGVDNNSNATACRSCGKPNPAVKTRIKRRLHIGKKKIKIIKLSASVILIIIAGIAVSNKPKVTPQKTLKQTYDQTKLRCDESLRCWAEKHMFDAAKICSKKIQAQAQYNYRWTNSTFEPKFSSYSWKNKKSGSIVYFGDRIEFQNGMGVWQSHHYKCAYQPSIKRAFAVEIIN